MNQKYCTQCGARLPETGAFCPECGARAQGDASPSPATLPATVSTSMPNPEAGLKRTPQGARRFPFVAFALPAVAIVVAAAAYFVAVQLGQSSVVVEPCVAGEDCAAAVVDDVHNDEGIPYPDVQRVTVADARALYDSGQATFVDVRDADAYAAAHIPESLLLPLAEIETGVPPLPRGGQIITYCT